MDFLGSKSIQVASGAAVPGFARSGTHPVGLGRGMLGACPGSSILALPDIM